MEQHSRLEQAERIGILNSSGKLQVVSLSYETESVCARWLRRLSVIEFHYAGEFANSWVLKYLLRGDGDSPLLRARSHLNTAN